MPGKPVVTYTHELHKGVVDAGAVGQEERASRAELVEEKKFLLLRI